MAIKHKKVSAVADGGDTDLVRPSDWNDSHDSPSFTVTATTVLANSNMPAAEAEWAGNPNRRLWYDLSKVTEMRLVVFVLTAGSAGSKTYPKYSTDGTSFSVLSSPASDLEVAVDTTGLKKSSWAPIVSGAKIDAVLSLWGSGGDGVADPSISFWLQVR